jgi:hypothetical protein
MYMSYGLIGRGVSRGRGLTLRTLFVYSIAVNHVVGWERRVTSAKDLKACFRKEESLQVLRLTWDGRYLNMTTKSSPLL